MDWNSAENETGERDRSMSDLDTSGRFWANGSGTFNDHNDYSMNFVVFCLNGHTHTHIHTQRSVSTLGKLCM